MPVRDGASDIERFVGGVGHSIVAEIEEEHLFVYVVNVLQLCQNLRFAFGLNGKFYHSGLCYQRDAQNIDRVMRGHALAERARFPRPKIIPRKERPYPCILKLAAAADRLGCRTGEEKDRPILRARPVAGEPQGRQRLARKIDQPRGRALPLQLRQNFQIGSIWPQALRQQTCSSNPGNQEFHVPWQE